MIKKIRHWGWIAKNIFLYGPTLALEIKKTFDQYSDINWLTAQHIKYERERTGNPKYLKHLENKLLKRELK